MSKAILVMDMPDSCNECDIVFADDYSNWCPCKEAKSDVYEYIQNHTRPDWCPLQEVLVGEYKGQVIKELPKKKEPMKNIIGKMKQHNVLQKLKRQFNQYLKNI